MNVGEETDIWDLAWVNGALTLSRKYKRKSRSGGKYDVFSVVQESLTESGWRHAVGLYGRPRESVRLGVTSVAVVVGTT